MDEILYLNNQVVDLSDSTVSLTSQINNIAELKDRQANYSNRIKLPKTPNNIAILDMLDVTGSKSRSPYINVSVKYVVDGIELISNGKGVITKTDNFYNLVIYSGNIGIVDLLGELTLSDLDFSSYNHNLNETTFFNSFSNTSGYIYGIGKFKETENYITQTVSLQIPSFYIHTLMEMIFEQKGITITGDLLTNSEYLKRVTTVAKGYTRDYSYTRTLEETDTTQPQWVETYGQEVTEKSFEVHSYTTTASGVHELEVNGYLIIQKGEDWYRLELRKNGTVIDSLSVTETLETVNWTASVQCTTGDVLTLEVFMRSALHINQQSITLFTYFTSKWYSNSADISIDFSTLFGDTKQIDFVKDVLQHFGAVFRKTRNKDEYEFKLMETLLNDRANAEDWSDKFVEVTDTSYKPNYAQINHFKYDYDDVEDSDEELTFADGSFSIDNVNLPKEKTLFTSLFKATQLEDISFVLNQKDLYAGYYWSERIVDGVTEIFKVEGGLRMFTITRATGTVRYRWDVDVENTASWVGNYAKLDFNGVDYNSEINLFYKGVENMLQDYKKLTINLNYSVLDNYQTDFFKLKYFSQLGKYYYLNKVNKFKTGKITSLEFVEVKKYVPATPPEDLYSVRMYGSTSLAVSIGKGSGRNMSATLDTGTTLLSALILVKAVPTLQQVTTSGNTTTNPIIVENNVTAQTSATQFIRLDKAGFLFAQLGTLNFFTISASGYIQFYNGSSFYTRFNFPTATQNNDIAVPDKSGTIALLSDLPTVPTIDDTAYGISWDANLDGATKNAIYDEIENVYTEITNAINQIPNVDDTVYGISWNGNLDAATKNAIYDAIQSVISSIPNIDDTAYGISWNGNTDGATKNAIYDKIQSVIASIPSTPNLQAVTDVNNVTTNDIQSQTSSTQFAKLFASGSLYAQLSNTYRIRVSSLGYIEAYVNQLSYRTRLEFPTATASRTITLPDADGTVALLTDIPSVPTISDDVYSGSWDANTDGATKNAIYDKIESVIASIPNIDDTVYGATWDGNTDGATKNAIYDAIESLAFNISTILDNGNLTTFGQVLEFLSGGVKIWYGSAQNTSAWTNLDGVGLTVKQEKVSGSETTIITADYFEMKYGATYRLEKPAYQSTGFYKSIFPKSNDKVLVTSVNGVSADATGDVTISVTGGATDITVVEGTTSVEIQSSTGTNDSIAGATETTAGVVTTGAQTWAGLKTFLQYIILNPNGFDEVSVRNTAGDKLIHMDTASGIFYFAGTWLQINKTGGDASFGSTTEATSSTNGALKTAGGLAVAKKGFFGDVVQATGFKKSGGTSTQVFTTDGGTATLPSGSGGLSSTTTWLTNTQVRNLNTTPVTLVSAQGTNKVITVHKIVLEYRYTSPAYSGTTTIYVAYASGGTICTFSNILNKTSDEIRLGNPTNDHVMKINSAVELTAISDPITGNGTLAVTTYYETTTIGTSPP